MGYRFLLRTKHAVQVCRRAEQKDHVKLILLTISGMRLLAASTGAQFLSWHELNFDSQVLLRAIPTRRHQQGDQDHQQDRPEARLSASPLQCSLAAFHSPSPFLSFLCNDLNNGSAGSQVILGLGVYR